jgi:hypothetical protein
MSKNRRYKTIIFSSFALLFPLVVAAQDISGWRTPIQADLGASDWRKEDPNLYLIAKADFDGDGKKDTAQLLINDKENKMGLFVTLASERNESALLLETTDKNEIRNMGIKAVKPGQYKTACGKGYWKCKKEEPEILNLKQSPIDFFLSEGANSYFIWDRKAKAFKRIWISD